MFGRKEIMYTRADKQKALGVLWMSLRFNTHLQKYVAEPCRVLAEKYRLPKALLLNTYATLEYEGILTTCKGSGMYADRHQYEILKTYLKEHRIKESFSDEEMIAYKNCIEVIEQSVKLKDINSDMYEKLEILEGMGMISQYEKLFIKSITDALNEHEMTKYAYLEYIKIMFID